MEILYQLGELFLEAIPTVVIVFLFYLFLRWSFFGPITRVMAERHVRTEGARRDAEASHAAAEEKVRQYQEALKAARAEVYAEQDTARRTLLEERAALLRSSRTRASEEVRAAKEKVAAQLAAAAAELERQTPLLAGEIVKAILERRPGGGRPVSEAR